MTEGWMFDSAAPLMAEYLYNVLGKLPAGGNPIRVVIRHNGTVYPVIMITYDDNDRTLILEA